MIKHNMEVIGVTFFRGWGYASFLKKMDAIK
jgi:hypothetical protein